MSSKKAEKAAFKRLKELFPKESICIICDYCSWERRFPKYYISSGTLNLSTITNKKMSVEAAVNLFIKERRKQKLKEAKELKQINP
jgi:hypothetical protein